MFDQLNHSINEKDIETAVNDYILKQQKNEIEL